MNWASDCAVVIPCFNEASAIAGVVRGAKRYLPTILVVDDGSSDSTASQAEQADARLVRHEANRGKGAALQSGCRWALERGFRWALTLDGDGQHSPDDIPLFLNCVQETGAALVVGNRMQNPASMPWVRRQVNRWMSWRLSRAAGQLLPDSQCGFRLMSLETWATLPITSSHFEIESEVLLEFAGAGCEIRFVPIQVIYKNQQSKIHPLHDTARWFRWWRERR